MVLWYEKNYSHSTTVLVFLGCNSRSSCYQLVPIRHRLHRALPWPSFGRRTRLWTWFCAQLGRSSAWPVSLVWAESELVSYIILFTFQGESLAALPWFDGWQRAVFAYHETYWCSGEGWQTVSTANISRRKTQSSPSWGMGALWAILYFLPKATSITGIFLMLRVTLTSVFLLSVPFSCLFAKITDKWFSCLWCLVWYSFIQHSTKTILLHYYRVAMNHYVWPLFFCAFGLVCRGTGVLEIEFIRKGEKNLCVMLQIAPDCRKSREKDDQRKAKWCANFVVQYLKF